MPENFVFIGFILAALPKSKIILLLRNPWDIAVSIYKQRYTKNITYASSFFNIAVYIANFEAMTTFWKSFLGGLRPPRLPVVRFFSAIRWLRENVSWGGYVRFFRRFSGCGKQKSDENNQNQPEIGPKKLSRVPFLTKNNIETAKWAPFLSGVKATPVLCYWLQSRGMSSRIRS